MLLLFVAALVALIQFLMPDSLGLLTAVAPSDDLLAVSLTGVVLYTPR